MENKEAPRNKIYRITCTTVATDLDCDCESITGLMKRL